MRRVSGLILVALAGRPLAAQTVEPAGLAHYARWVWRTTGRMRLERYSGVAFDSSRNSWTLVPEWSDSNRAGALAYYAEPILRGALALAEATSDRSVLEDVAGFYLTYLGRFTTVRSINRGRFFRRGSLVDPGLPSARTLRWPRPGGQIDECPLCNAQILAPAARLVRLIAAEDASARTEVQRRFVSAYVPLLSREHVVRLATEARWDFGVRGWPDRTLVDAWRAVSRGEREGAPAYQFAVHDRDLWLVGAAADLLEAQRLAPDIVALGGSEQPLREVVAAGISRVKESITQHPATKDWSGRIVGSEGYFEGDWDAYPDLAFAGNTSPTLPTATWTTTGVSWDVSHLQRLPVFLRTIWDDRHALASDFPTFRNLQLAVHQYLYVAFRGDLRRPLFRNFYDGGDGWYRVGMVSGAGAGYPPSTSCDSRDATRPCLGTWAISGWGLLRCTSGDLQRLLLGVFGLAAATDTTSQEFRARYFTAYGRPLAFTGVDGRPLASLLLAQVASEYLAGARCGPDR